MREALRAWSSRQQAMGNGALPNLGAGGMLVAIFVASFFAAQFADAVAVIIVIGPHAFFVDGVRVTNWKHGLLSTGAVLSGGMNFVRMPLMLLGCVLLVGLAEYSAGALAWRLARRSPWLSVAARLMGGALLLLFAGWLYRDGFLFLHPIPLSAAIGGIVMIWRSLAGGGA